MFESIKSKLQFLSTKYKIEVPQITVQFTQDSTYQHAQMWYDKTYDSCSVKFILNQKTTQKTINKFIAHQFAHCVTKQLMLMQELTLARLDHCNTIFQMFKRTAQIIAKRLEIVFIEDLNKEYKKESQIEILVNKKD